MKSEMQKGFEAQRAAGINVDWFTWQIAWNDARALLAAGASEGQEPVAWITEAKYPAPRFVIGCTDPSDVWKQAYTPLYTHPSAEIAALRERIAGMEKDAEIWQTIITSGLYDRMNDITGGDREARHLIEEMIAMVDPLLQAKWDARAEKAKEPI